jgi:hypothetical protein
MNFFFYFLLLLKFCRTINFDNYNDDDIFIVYVLFVVIH